jgi:hypothetical protein
VIRFEASRYRTAFVCLLIFFATLSIYWPVRHYNFVEFDDPDYVFDNTVVRAGLTHWGLVWSFVDAHSANWHPLTWLSHMLDCQLFGLNTGAHHLVNVLFHCANAVLLLLLLNSLTSTFWRNAFIASVFALHPLRVESVAWISERKDVLSGFFFMLTLLAYVRYARWPIQNASEQTKPPAIIPRSDFYKLSLCFFVLGLLSKPMLVTVPLVLLLIDFWPLNRFESLNQLPTASRRETARSLLLEKAPFIFFAIVFSVITYLVQKSGGAPASVKFTDYFFQIEGVLMNYLGYLEKILWPENLSVLYLRPENVGVGLLIFATLILSAISIVAVVNSRRRPYLLFGWLWFLVMLFPVSGIVQIGRQSIADRYTYLPSIGLAVMLTWGVVELAEFLFSPKIRRICFSLAAAGILSACGIVTRHQLTYWQNTETLMNRALELNPKNYVAHNNLAFYFLRQGKRQLAIMHFKRARELGREVSDNSNRAVSDGK